MSFEKPWGNYLLEGIVETIAPQNISFWPQTLAWQFIFIVTHNRYYQKNLSNMARIPSECLSPRSPCLACTMLISQ